jgi:hypothetical protein
VTPDRRSGVQPDGSWLPAFVGQRPPFREGEAGPALRTGCYSVLKLAPRAIEIRAELEPVVPLRSDADSAVLDLLAGTLAQAERALLVLARVQVDEIDAIRDGKRLDPDARQNLGRLSADTRGWINSAARLCAALGLTPTSRAALGVDLARTLTVVDLHAAAALEGEAVEEAEPEPAA